MNLGYYAESLLDTYAVQPGSRKQTMILTEPLSKKAARELLKFEERTRVTPEHENRYFGGYNHLGQDN